MSKGHRDNHAARVKRGKKAFQKKAKRRETIHRCIQCGQRCRPQKLQNGLFCPKCVEKQRAEPKSPPVTIYVQPGLETPVTRAFAERLKQMEQEFLYGSGTEKPRGIVP